jgi:hypothetical protein
MVVSDEPRPDTHVAERTVKTDVGHASLDSIDEAVREAPAPMLGAFQYRAR